MIPQDPAAAFDGKAFVATLPGAAGVYRMLADDGGVLYVGKAANLRKRVGSYFLRPQLDPRLAAMVARIASVEYTATRTEAEALLLENELIKSLKPRYNVLLRDDKSYPYIYLSGGEDFPRMAFHRGARTGPGRYFGPFPSAHAVRESLSLMQKLFKIRQCEDSYFRNRSRPCLQFQIGRCSAPCVGLVGAQEYQHDVRHAGLFLDGQSSRVIGELVQQMEQASESLEFERAARTRDQIGTLKRVQAQQFVADTEPDADILACRVREGIACIHAMYFRNGVSLGSRSYFPRPGIEVDEGEVLGAFVTQYYLDRPPPSVVILSHAIPDEALIAQVLGERRRRMVELRHSVRGDRARLVEMALRNAELALGAELATKDSQVRRWQALTTLLELENPPARVECFDISHTMGEATVASCVVFDANGPVKSQYRRYNIAGITPGDDYAAMRQALERRFRRACDEGAEVPELLLIDGGAGQVAGARAVLGELGVTRVAVVGVAKGEERRPGLEVLILGERLVEARPDAAHAGLHAIQQIRDEAHRFAITGHRARREKKRETSRLEEIAGVGSRRRAALLKHFGGLAGVQRAGVEELMQVPGINRGIAERIYAALHG
ncbi:MAG TPA: excinuclease ABC subunit UvrC [Candidatus Saccharimonadia bacterium]|nr:excinuclease ABC subunit UvrC [Candidatus Saccharimonadia bacterium]